MLQFSRLYIGTRGDYTYFLLYIVHVHTVDESAVGFSSQPHAQCI